MAPLDDSHHREAFGAFAPRRQHDATHAPPLFLSETPVQIGERSDFLSRLTKDEARRVRETGRALTVQAGETVFLQGDAHDGIFLVEAGIVRSYYTGPSGREITLAYWPVGHFVGGPEIFGGGVHLWSGVAVMACHLLKLRGDALRRLVETIPALAIGLVDGLVAKGRCYSMLVQMLGTRSVVERLAQLLCILAETSGKPAMDGVCIDRTLTHEDLARMVGATRQWVTATLDKFQKRGVIVVRDRRIVVTDGRFLADIAGGEPDSTLRA